jgi:hypothetical protein
MKTVGTLPLMDGGLLLLAVIVVAMVSILDFERVRAGTKKAATGARRAINGLLQTASRHRRRARGRARSRRMVAKPVLMRGNMMKRPPNVNGRSDDTLVPFLAP